MYHVMYNTSNFLLRLISILETHDYVYHDFYFIFIQYWDIGQVKSLICWFSYLQTTQVSLFLKSIIFFYINYKQEVFDASIKRTSVKPIALSEQKYIKNLDYMLTFYNVGSVVNDVYVCLCIKYYRVLNFEWISIDIFF